MLEGFTSDDLSGLDDQTKAALRISALGEEDRKLLCGLCCNVGEGQGKAYIVVEGCARIYDRPHTH